jgi:hypothetical protein
MPLMLAACAAPDSPTSPRAERLESRVERLAEHDDDDDDAEGRSTRVYDVTITNLTSGQPFSPGVLVTHTRAASVFRVGSRASEGLRLIAEDGNQAAALAELTGRPGVFQVVDVNVPTGRLGGPLPTSRTFRIEARANANRLSLVVMLICTNDGFTGLHSVRLPRSFSAQTFDAAGYDAGTEANDERSTSIVDPCFAIGPTAGAADGNARPATDGVVTHHPGIQGHADLVPAAHGWSNPVARITVQRVR